MRVFGLCRKRAILLIFAVGTFLYLSIGPFFADISVQEVGQRDLIDEVEIDEAESNDTSAERLILLDNEDDPEDRKNDETHDNIELLKVFSRLEEKTTTSARPAAPEPDYEQAMIRSLVQEAERSLTQDRPSEEVPEVEASARNVTPSDTNVLFFSAVPKCGSSTTGHLLKTLSMLNNYYVISPQLRIQAVLDTNQQRTLFQSIYDLSTKIAVAYTRHLYYINSTNVGFPRPAWVAIVRHPVERLISQFYYARIPERYLENKLLQGRMPNAEFMNMTLDSCVPTRDPRCWYRPGSRHMLQLSFLCGQEPFCTTVGSKRALQMAKYNAENFYSVVGVLEELSLSYKVLEKYLPLFFAQASSNEIGAGAIRYNSQENKPVVQNTTRALMEIFLKEDLDLYYFLKQRLHLQARTIGAENGQTYDY